MRRPIFVAVSVFIALFLLGWVGLAWLNGSSQVNPLPNPAATASASEVQAAQLAAADPTARTRLIDSTEQPSLRVKIVNSAGEPLEHGRATLVPAQRLVPMGIPLDNLAEFPQDDWRTVHTTSSDASGFCNFEDLNLTGIDFALNCEAPGYLSQRSWWQLDGADLGRTLTVVLKKAHAVRIRVLDEATSQPIEGAQFRGSWSVGGRRHVRSSRSDHTGGAVIWFAPGQELQCSIRQAGYLASYLSIEANAGVQAEAVREVLLRRGRALEVVVKEADGKPLHGARVYLSEIDRQSENAQQLADPSSVDRLYRGTTDVAGHLLVSGITQQRGLQIWVEFGERSAQQYPVRADDLVEVIFPAAVTNRWLFVNAQGEAVPGLDIALVSTDFVGWPPVARGVSDVNGSCEFTVSPGNYAIFAVNENWAFASQEPERIDPDGPALRRCEVEPAAGLKLHASTARSTLIELPFASLARVYAQPDAWEELPQPHWSNFAVNLNADRMGYLKDSEQFVGLIPGQYRVWVQGAGCLSKVVPVELKAGEVAEVEAILEEAAVAQVQVVDPLGNPVEQARLWIYSLEDLESTGLERPMAANATDARGFAYLTRLKVGEAEIQYGRRFLGPRESMRCVIEQGENSFVVRLSNLLGAVTVSVDPRLRHAQSQARVRLMRVNAQGVARRSSSEPSAAIDDTNSVQLDDVQPGEYEVVLAGIRALARAQRITVEQGQTTHVSFSAESLPVSSIQVLGPKGSPLAGAYVLVTSVEERNHPTNLKLALTNPALQREQHIEATTGDDGIARILGEIPEECQVLAFAPGFQIESQHCRPIPGLEPPFATLRLQPAAELSVRLRRYRASGEAVTVRGRRGEYRVWADQAGREYRVEENDQTMAFRIAILAPGAVDVRVERRVESGEWVQVASRSGTIADDGNSDWTITLEPDSN